MDTFISFLCQKVGPGFHSESLTLRLSRKKKRILGESLVLHLILPNVLDRYVWRDRNGVGDDVAET